ncbi:MAG TPA: alkaline phosphatase D family protein [Pirellulales bacterium]|jgi:alkaline phosphatase D|nr:alkaline phosphatase D family protein [Pirellulales bacterium]
MPLKLHVAARSWTRRGFLAAGGALAAWPLLGRPADAVVRRALRLKDHPFKLGVASGEPTPDGFVLWTRLAPDPLAGGGMPAESVEVGWEVARDEKMSQVVASGTAVATPETAHAIHVEVPGLEPDRWYFYRFTAAGETSPLGRTRTAPPADSLPKRLRFAFASCQHYEYGYFTAYEHMAREDLDLIIHLGDYIYEYGTRPKAVRKHVGPECVSLDEYRTRYAQYRTDAHLQAAHALVPWMVTWDDHEFDNNCAGVVSEEPGIDPAQYLARRARAYQAYYEHMPLRKAQLPQGPNARMYRQQNFGRLASFAMLDTRQYRTDQPCGDGNKPPCDAVYDPHATLLGDEQEKWLYRTLKASPARWNVLAQQVMMARVDRKPGEIVAYSMDQWPGYEANRQRVLKFLAEGRVANPIVLTGDIHSNWVNDLQVNAADRRSPVVGTEFVGTSITSGGDGKPTGGDTAGVLAENPFVKFYNRERGYVACEVTPDRWQSHYRTVEYVSRPGAPRIDRQSFVVLDGRPGAQPA